MRLIAFAAKCQRVDIRTQYLKYGVRCFDLRIRSNGKIGFVVAHGIVEYAIDMESLMDELRWLNQWRDCYVRVIHEVRTERQYTEHSVKWFGYTCHAIEESFPNIRFWCGRNLYNWKKDYIFGDFFTWEEEPTCEETYGSVVPGKKWLYCWWPWLYARTHNKAIKARGTDKDILLIDYVDI